MSKRLNYYQAHKNKRPRAIEIPKRLPTKEQLDDCIDELNRLLAEIGIKKASRY